MHISDRLQAAILAFVDFYPFQFKHLYLKPLGESASVGNSSLAPGENTGIAARLHVSPLNVKDKVFVLFCGAHDADGVARTNQ